MERKLCTAVFMPAGREVRVEAGTTLLDAARTAGVNISATCGGNGTCGKCRVKVVRGLSEPDEAERKTLGGDAVAAGYRLACRSAVMDDCTVKVPAGTGEQQHNILHAALMRPVTVDPAVRKIHFELPAPSMDDSRSDSRRLCDFTGHCGISHGLMGRLPAFLREYGWKGTAVIVRNSLIALEKGDTSSVMYGLALDIGTTTVVGSLIDLAGGEAVHTSSCVNPQNAYGDDVLSRIKHAGDDPGGTAKMQQVLVQALNTIVADLVRKAGIKPWSIYDVVTAGNTTMQQLLCGYDVTALGEMPFVPVFERFHRIRANHIGLKVHPKADLTVYGQIGGFVGGDTLAGMVAARMDSYDKPVLLVDIGTNGELALATRDGIAAASTAAGPALEGARIRHGMRAMAGAIDEVVIGSDLVYRVIGGTLPTGICGSGILDTVAEMVRTGILDETGVINAPEDVPAALPEAVKVRIVSDGNGTYDFMLARAEEAGIDEAIMITQRDIRELQLATAAVQAGIRILLKESGVTLDELDRILLAGAFGNFIKIASVLGTGLLPPFDPARISPVGNASLAGAHLMLVSRTEEEYAEKLRSKTKHINLSLNPDFTMAFADAMMFPQAAVTPATALQGGTDAVD